MSTTVNASSLGINIPVASMAINGNQLPQEMIEDVSVSVKSDEHEVATFTVKMASLDVTFLKNQTVYFRYGTAPDYGYFYGYVYQVGKPQKFQESVKVTVKCLGHTFNLKSPAHGMYRNVPAETIVRGILSKHKMGYFSNPHWYTYDRFTATGMSEWEVLSKLAYEQHRHLTSLSGAVWAFEPLDELKVGAAAFSFKKSGNVLDAQDRALLDFSPGDSNETDVESMLPQFAYFAGDGTVVPYTPPGAATDARWASEYYVGSPDKARYVIENGIERNRLTQSAVVRVRGTGAVRPGHVVNISTGVVDTLKDSFDGLWIVVSVQHSINTTAFQTGLTLVRDRYRSINPRVKYRSFYERDSRGFPQMTVEGTRWVSTWRS